MEESAYHISGVAAIIFIAIGILIFILLFIFAKRQIMRFALKSPNGPHIHLARDAPKHLKSEIERRLNIVKDIKYEPKLLSPYNSTSNESKEVAYQHFFRMKAIDSLSILEDSIVDSCGDHNRKRPPGQDLRYYLLKLVKDDGPLNNCDTKLINQLVDCYNSARHEPYPVFGLEEYNQFMTLLNTVRNSISTKNSPSNRKCSSVNSKVKDTKDTKDTTAQMVFNGKTQVSLRQNKVEFIDTNETSV